jgi:predicted transcriptional regulator
MRRTQIYLTEEERRALKTLAERQGRPQSAIIREAVDRYLEREVDIERRERLRAARGLWRDHTGLPDPERLREELERPRSDGSEADR